MRGTIRSGRVWPKALTLAVFACAMLLRVIVPVGWMPVSDAHGFRITICTGTGAVDAPPVALSAAQASLLVAMHHAPKSDDHQGADHPCVFSGLGLALAEPDMPSLATLPAMASVVLPAALFAVSIGHGLAAPPPPATGPPLLA